MHDTHLVSRDGQALLSDVATVWERARVYREAEFPTSQWTFAVVEAAIPPRVPDVPAYACPAVRSLRTLMAPVRVVRRTDSASS